MPQARSRWFVVLALIVVGGVGIVVTGTLASGSVGSMMGVGSGQLIGGTPGQMMGGDSGQMMGRALAGQGPETISAGQAANVGIEVPAGATVDRASNQIRFTGSDVKFTMIASPDTGPDMTFQIAGLADPTITMPVDATATIRLVNGDQDTSHGWEVAAGGPPFPYMPMMDITPAFAGSLAPPLGDASSTTWPAETITFKATAAGTYRYLCPVPGHAQQGMHGDFEVR